MINSYQFGRIIINQTVYVKDVIVFPYSVQENWQRKEGHLLILEDIKEALQKLKPKILVVGTGQLGVMKIDSRLIKFLETEDIRLHAEKTGKAVKIYNRFILINDNVLGVFHLTC